jgi:carbon-monoxide dehydrogenase large subunit
VIGAAVPRKEDERLLRGAGCYTHDVTLPRQAHMVMVRSPHAHARIISVDSAAARAAPGVLGVLTGVDARSEGIADIPGYAGLSGQIDVPLVNRDGSARRTTPLPLLAVERVRFVGDPVAAVIAESLAEAQDAAELVAVAYDPLAAVTTTDPPAGAAAAAPALWDHIPANLCIDGEFGDAAAAQAAFAQAAHVVRLSTAVQRVAGVMMETRAAVSDYDAAGGQLTVYCGGDNSVRLKNDLAAIVGMPPERVRVVARDIGGNFGTRNWCYPEYGITAWASRKLGRPVAWRASRSESFLADCQGRELTAEAELALDRDGRFLALRADLASNIGGYTVSFVPINKTGELLCSLYAFPAANVRCRAILSNTPPTAPYRSAGRPEAMYVIERLIDRAAARCGFDRIELRRRNLIPASAMPYRTALGLTYDSGDYAQAMERVLALSDWQGFPARRAEARRRGQLRGIGFAHYIEVTTGFPVEQARIHVLPAGWIDVVVGTTPSGQGHETSFAQCVAGWLGVELDRVRIITGDTAIVKAGGGSHSARSMRMAGIVMGGATEKIVARGIQIAAHMLESAGADIEFAAGRFSLVGTDRSIGLFEVAAAALERTDLPEELCGPLAAEHTHRMGEPGFPYGAQVCEVEVDPDTGACEIVTYSAVDDVGRAINPLILHGQAHGGIAQGAGQALLEHARYDPSSGQLLAGTLMDYTLPRASDFPFFRAEIMEIPTPTNPLGVRGGGEGGTTPALGVVINALLDALAEFGVEELDMPATPERIWRAIAQSRHR